MTTATDPWATDGAPSEQAHRIVFLDTETTGLEPDADVWEVGAIIRDTGQHDVEVQFFVEHDEAKAARLPEPFLSDYRARYDPAAAITREEAASRVAAMTSGANVVGAVPNFDTERLAPLLRAADYEPGWHYHLIDVENLAVGYLANSGGQFSSWHSLMPPWDSDTLSRALGVEPPKQGEGRHTALGDARWCRAVFDAVMGTYGLAAGAAVPDFPPEDGTEPAGTPPSEPPSLDETSGALVAMLRAAGGHYGPLGVAQAAALLVHPDATVGLPPAPDDGRMTDDAVLAVVMERGHFCPNAADLAPDVDDYCDLPDELRRFRVALNLGSRIHGRSADEHKVGGGVATISRNECRDCLWHDVVATFRAAARGRLGPPPDDLVYSRTGTARGDGSTEYKTWRQVAAEQRRSLDELSPLAALMRDLTRCEHGRCAGDDCGGCGGPSHGNPRAPYTVGYSMSGREIVLERLGDWRSMAGNAAEVEGVTPEPVVTVGGEAYYPRHGATGPRPR